MRSQPLAASIPLMIGFWFGGTNANAQPSITGYVRDSDTNEPLAGALVSLQASIYDTETGADGYFELPFISEAVVVAAAKKGYFTNSIRLESAAADTVIELSPVPSDDGTAPFTSPESCASCHPDQFLDWRLSAMSHAGTNTWVYDTYDGTGTDGGLNGFVYTRDSRLAHDNPASECRSCHQPEDWADAPYTALGPASAPSEGDLRGVSCEICHKAANIDETKPNYPGVWPGVYSLSRPAGHQVQYGALGDATYTMPGLMQPSYQPQLPAAICAACHQDKNDPDEDGDFEEDNGIISEPTYLEWLASPYADEASALYTTCATCHMPAASAAQACNLITLRRPAGDVRRHTFEGTTAAYLDNAVSLTLTSEVGTDGISVVATITNDQTGHSVPTGVTIRNMILLVEAIDADGASLQSNGTQTVHELGGVGDPAQGYYAGLPGKLYAKVIADAEGNAPTFFTDAASIVFDNRIAALDSDASRYAFALPTNRASNVTIRARLLYRRSWRALIDSKSWTTNGHGDELEDLTPPLYGHLMEEVEQTISLCSTDDHCDEDEVCSERGSCTLGARKDTREGCSCNLLRSGLKQQAPVGLHILLLTCVLLSIRKRLRPPRH